MPETANRRLDKVEGQRRREHWVIKDFWQENEPAVQQTLLISLQFQGLGELPVYCVMSTFHQSATMWEDYKRNRHHCKHMAAAHETHIQNVSASTIFTVFENQGP